ncbi:unnamed protein product [Ciceribacter sp. T2.26MG-112.2]|nr:unnamed protein product [Ciceribacter naphthalenivorans]
MPADVFVGDHGNHLLHPRLKLGALFRRVELPAAGLAHPQHLRERPGLGQHLVERRASILLDEIIRILAVRQHGEADRPARLQMRQRQVDGTERRPLTGTVAVKAKHRHRRHLPHQVELVFGERRAERRNGVLDAGLVERDDIHVAFDRDDRIGAGGALERATGAGEIEEHIALVKELGLRRVHVFGHGIGRHRPAAKRDHLVARGQDREHDTVAEIIVGDGNVRPVPHQAAGLDLLLRHTLAGQIFLKRVAALRRIAEAEGFDRPPRKPAFAQIGPRPGAARRLQLILEELRRHFHDVLQRGAFLLAPLGLRIGLRHGDTGHVGDLLHRFGKAQPLEIGEKAEMVAGNAATETVVASLAVLAVKARAFFAVERAAGPIVPARHIGLLAIPSHTSTDHRGNRHAVAYLVEKVVGKTHHVPCD